MIPTAAGVATISEAYAALQDHLTECQELAAVLSHLHNTEHSSRDLEMARRWLQVSELLKQFKRKTNLLAQGYTLEM